MQILVINCGSSSLKYCLMNSADQSVVLSGKMERLAATGSGRILTHRQAVRQMLSEINDRRVDAVGYRIVHGGGRYTAATVIDADVLREIEARIPDAPMHNPYALEAVRATQALLPDVQHVAVFDTAFHSRLPKRAKMYAIDATVAQKYGIQRFGFHGISHAYVAEKAAGFLRRPLTDLRLITLHLGNGASACAVEYGHSTETSMGNTPLEGLVMGSRSGDVDAGVLLSLLRSGDFDVAGLDDMLNNHSGLAGLSQVGNDLREIEDRAEAGDSNARLAINVFAHRARKYIGAYAATMGGVDAVVFTGGIGENSVTMRRRILQRLEFLGLYLDEDRNSDASVTTDRDYALITAEHSKVEVLVVKTNEELRIAQETAGILSGGRSERQSATRVNADLPVQVEGRSSGTDRVTAGKELAGIPIAVSARHAHFTVETFAALFGPDAKLTHYRDLSQPGQFAAHETVNLIGPRNRIDKVRVLGPLRPVNQIEISRSDEFTLGIDAPVRDSGQVKDSAPIMVEGPAGKVYLSEGLICARRHIHMHPDDAEAFGVVDRQDVAVTLRGGPRDLVFGDVLIRVSSSYRLEMHIDTDEGNAAELGHGATGELVYEDIDEAYAELV